MKITKLESQKNNSSRISIYVDDEFCAGINQDVLLKFDLFEGKDVSKQIINQILNEEEYLKCLERIYSLLAMRMQTRLEIYRKLRGKFTKFSIDKAVFHLEELGYIDDNKFTKLWLESRGKSRGPKLLRLELIKKGVSKEIINEQLGFENISKEEQFEAALCAYHKKKWPEMTKEERFTKIGGYLARKGFDYEIIKRILNSEK